MSNKPIKKVIVIGGGFGGLRALYNLSEYSFRFEVTLIDKNDYTLEKPGLLDVVFDNKDSKDVTFLLPPQARVSNAGFIQAEIKRVEPKEKYVVLDDESKVKYDYLFIASGQEVDKSAIKGLDEFGYSICNLEDAKSLKERLADFKDEKIVIGSAKSNLDLNVAYEGVVAELALNLSDYIKERELNTKIEIFTPNSDFLNFIGESSRQKIKELLKAKNIEIVYNKEVCEVSKDRVEFIDKSYLESNLSIVIPPYKLPKFIKDSSLASEDKVVTNENMEHIEYDNIYVVGDVNALAKPKMGYIALHQADVATTTLIEREKLENENKVTYSPDIFTILKSKNEGVLIYSNYIFGGDKDIVWISPIAKWLKIGFSKEYHYTHGSLPPIKVIEEIEKVIEYLNKK